MIAIVIPTIREGQYQEFLEAWRPLFEKHSVHLVKVTDGDNPDVNGNTIEEVMGEDSNLIFNRNDGVRNLGFAYVAKELPDIEYILTLDDDVRPIGDPIQDHLDALNMNAPLSWLSTASEYMRGFPYEIRDEAPVKLSHGVWEGVKDYDAPTQLVNGNKDVTFYKGAIPKGIYFPMCIMNVAFRREMIPYMYQAPMGVHGLDRFADIWSGIDAKRALDERGWAAVTGYSTILHNRASNVFVNLQKEAKGIGLNEGYWKGVEEDEYFALYRQKREQWQNFIERLL